MITSSDFSTGDDPFHLSRFLRAQEDSFEHALAEIRDGRKRTHWIWFIFPSFEGLSSSSTSKRYSIKSLEEARAYLADPVLGPRLLECVKAVIGVEGKTAHEIFGSPDDLKVKACATLFALVSPEGSPFERLLEGLYDGEKDARTLELLGVVTDTTRLS